MNWVLLGAVIVVCAAVVYVAFWALVSIELRQARNDPQYTHREGDFPKSEG
jgi:type II secretory pathway component PulM